MIETKIQEKIIFVLSNECTINDVAKEIGINNPIYVGRIYVYERWEGKENRTQFLMHRLVGVNDEKTKFVFLGDNNLYVDPLVNRSQIMREVIGACFNRLCEE